VFNETLDYLFCKRTKAFPAADMYWGLLALLSAIHPVHIDTDGLATFIAPQTGCKFWIFGQIKPSMSFSATNIYVGSTYAINKINDDLYDTEGILLRVKVVL
jgi:hypothetical protein